jgi:hypothetical protein
MLTTTLATTTMVTQISSDAKTALRNYFIDLIVATMAQPTTTTAATASSTALATTTTTLVTTMTVTRISSEAKTALRNYFIERKLPLNKNLPRGRELVDILGTLLKNVVPDSNDCLGGLSHAQIARHLLNYKKDVFGMQWAVNNMSSLELEAKLEEEKLTMKEEEEKLTMKASRKIQAFYSLAAANLSMEYDTTQQSTKITDSG